MISNFMGKEYLCYDWLQFGVSYFMKKNRKKLNIKRFQRKMLFY